MASRCGALGCEISTDRVHLRATQLLCRCQCYEVVKLSTLLAVAARNDADVPAALLHDVSCHRELIML